MIIKFGTIQEETILESGVVIHDHETIHNGATTSKHRTYTQKINVNGDKEALAEFLRLADEYKAGHISRYGVQCYSNAEGRIYRIEKSWTV